MVFTSNILQRFVKSKGTGPHRFWRKRRVLSLCGHLAYRNQRCYRLAIRVYHRTLLHAKNSRTIRKKLARRIWNTRLDAACSELSTNFDSMRKVLSGIGIGVDRKILQNFAIWEPRTFRGLAMLTKAKSETQGLNSLDPPPKGVITRGMI